MKKPKAKVLIAMSGGVDSSVAALLLKNSGFQVIGAFMKSWSDTKDDLGQCTWIADRKMAVKIASQLNIPLITLDFEKEYRKQVVDEMFKAYSRGITPNPDVDCNNKVKFPLLWQAAKKLGCDFIATGHYARIKKISMKNGVNNIKSYRVGSTIKNISLGRVGGVDYNYELLRAKDESKDQSYFLYRLTQKDLEHSLFPVGNYDKTQVRQIAKKNKFPNFNRKSTTGICFIGKVNLKKFLQARIPSKVGKILDPNGKQIGEHGGIYYYTIGQRIGPRFGIDIDKGKETKRWYVASKNPRKNEIVAAPENHKLNFRKEIIIKQPHWINEVPEKNKRHNVKARIRQVGELLVSTLSYKNGKYKIILNKLITGVSEGQAVVLYQGTKVLGGGVIGFKMDNRYFMSLAIDEAERSRDKDRYYVGAVIVKNSRIISKAYSDETKDMGHAEELAIKTSKENVSGATMYVTMEPCSFRPAGRLSCSDLIINSRIARVVYGTPDPQVRIPCVGIGRLVAAGIDVIHLRELEERCKQITPSLFK